MQTLLLMQNAWQHEGHIQPQTTNVMMDMTMPRFGPEFINALSAIAGSMTILGKKFAHQCKLQWLDEEQSVVDCQQ